MATPTRLLSAEEFLELPDLSDGGKMELVDGEVVCMAPVGGSAAIPTASARPM